VYATSGLAWVSKRQAAKAGQDPVLFREAAIAQNESTRFSDSAMTIRGANPGLRLFVLKHCIKSILILLQAGLDEVRRGRDQSRPGYEDQAGENDAPGALRRWLGHR